jgi:hypothetical protein
MIVKIMANESAASSGYLGLDFIFFHSKYQHSLSRI